MTTQDRPAVKLDRLTQSERECLRMVAQHMRSKEIARSRGTSPYTVNRQIESACKKLGAATRQDAARIWISVEGEPPTPMPSDSAYDSLGIVNVPSNASVDEATEASRNDHNDDIDHDTGDHQFHLEAARNAAQGTGGKPGTGIHGSPPGFRARETIPVSRGIPAAERNHEDGGLRGRPEFPADRRLTVNRFGVAGRVVLIALIALAMGVVVTGILATAEGTLTILRHGPIGS
jgi:DNA-binding CsgD family transcriptional regulator